MVKRIALTGGIGSGKSTALALVRARGYVVFDADLLAREVVLLPEVRARIEAAFGEGLYTAAGDFDRAQARTLVFSSPEKRLQLEAITHPAIAQQLAKRRAELETLCSTAWIFYEASLIFETGRQKDFDAVVLVSATEATRMARLAQFRNMPASQAEAIMAAQWPEERKAALAHFVIDNSAGKPELEQNIANLIDALRTYLFLPNS